MMHFWNPIVYIQDFHVPCPLVSEQFRRAFPFLSSAQEPPSKEPFSDSIYREFWAVVDFFPPPPFLFFSPVIYSSVPTLCFSRNMGLIFHCNVELENLWYSYQGKFGAIK